jgi:outer membrane autotransporter protein
VNSGALTFSANADLGGATRILTTASDVEFGGIVSNGGLTKLGSGILTLSGANTYTGLTDVQAGTLSLSGGAAIANAAAVTVSGGTLDVDDAETVGAVTLSSGTISGDSALTSATAIDARAGAISAALDGAAGLTKTTGGTVTLSGANTYTGATTITAGTLQLDGSTAAGSTVGVGTAGTLTGSGAVNGNATLTGSGVINKSGGTIAGTLGVTGGNWNGAGAVTGLVTSSSGTFTIGNGANLTANGNLNVTGGSIASGNSASTITGSVNYTSATSSSFGGVIAGAGKTLTMNNADATLTLSGANSYTGGTTISAGTIVAGSASALGTGAAAHVTNGATLDIGTTDLNIGGNYAQTGTLKFAANSVSDYGSVAAGGTGNVAGAIDITVGGYLANGATLNMLSSTGALTYDAATTLNVFGDTKYTFTGAKSGNVLILTASRAENGFASDAGGNSNSAAVGAVLDNIPGATGDMLNVLNTLDGMSAGAVGTALGTMTPDVSSGTAEGSHALTGQGFTMISNRLGGARNGGSSGSGVSSGETLNGVGVWMQGLGSHMKQNERKGIEGFTANTWGTTVGADKVLDNHFRAGLAGSYGWARVKSKTPGNPSDDINSYQATVYGSYDSLDLCKARQGGPNTNQSEQSGDWGRPDYRKGKENNSQGGKKSYEAVRSQVEDSWYVDGMMAFTQNNYDSRREIWPGSAKRVAKADHYGQQYSTNFETGYKFVFEETKDLEVTPFASLGYNYLYMNKYKEKGADALNLNVEGEGFHQLEQALGTKLAYPIVAKKVGTFIPSAKAAWLYDYIGDRFETTASFAGGGASFNTVGAKPAKNGMLFGAELAFLDKGNITVTGNWDIELKDEFVSNTYYGTVRYDF